MKKKLIILLFMVMCIIIGACGNKQIPQAEKSTHKGKHELELVESSYSILISHNKISIQYTAIIRNPSSDFAVVYPRIKVISSNEKGDILGDKEYVIPYIAAGDIITYSDCMFLEENVTPSNVEISIQTGKNNYRIQSEKYLPSNSFEFMKVSVKKGKWFNRATGRIKNLSEQDVYLVAVSVNFLKDGKYIGGDTNFAVDIPAGETVPFNFTIDCEFEDYDKIVLCGIEWKRDKWYSINR